MRAIGRRRAALAGALALALCGVIAVHAAASGLRSRAPQPPFASGVAVTPPAPRVDAAAVRRYVSSKMKSLAPREIHALARTIVAEADRYGFEPSLVLAVIHVESRFDANAVSPVGARGLMQLMPTTGEDLAASVGLDWTGPDMLFDPIVNVRLGVAYLRALSNRYGSLDTALAAYNWGPGRIDARLRGGEPVPEIYPQLVLSAYGALGPASRS